MAMADQKGGRGTITLKEEATLNHPVEVKLVKVNKGTEFPVLAWRIEGELLIFTLDDYKIEGRNTWQVAAALVDFCEAQPENSPIIRAPDKQMVVPYSWTPNNIILGCAILQGGSFSWAEATHGGTRMPPNQRTVDAIIRIARLAQQARQHFGRPMIVTSWHRPPHINKAVGGAIYSRHIVGDAIDFIVEGMTGDQIYWSLDPWWPGGLGRYKKFPNLGHIDGRNERTRWLN